MKHLFFAAALLFALCSVTLAQTPDTEPATPQSVDQDKNVTPQEGEPSPTARSLIDGIVSNTTTHLGFAFSSYEMYSTDSLRDSNGSDLTMTMFYPQIFTNFRSKRSQVHLDYSLGYRMYRQQGAMNTFSHSASASWDLRLARNTVFQLADSFTSSPNDYGFSLGQPGLLNQLAQLSQFQIQPIFSQEVFVARQRLIRNSVVASVNQRVGKRTHVSVFANHDYLKYDGSSFGNSQGTQLGVQASIQLKSWLFLDNSYSTYLNTVDERFRASNIHRLQVGGFHFKISRNTSLYTMGTVEYTHYFGVGHTVAGFEGGLSRATKSNSFSISYHRGLSTTLGPGTILNGQNATVGFSQRLSKRFTLQMDAAYMRGVGFLPDSFMQSHSGNGGIQFALQRNLIASANVGYVSQRITNLPFVFAAPNLSRYTAFAGLQYFMPTLRGR